MNTLAIVVTALYAITTVQSQGVFNKADTETDVKPDEQGENAASDLTDAREEHIDRIAQTHNLTPRETEILHYLAKGHTGTYVAKVLFISPNTARTHIHNIYRKLNVSSREEILHLTR
jgi:DNA-binding CsgD family transcriptional regulator